MTKRCLALVCLVASAAAKGAPALAQEAEFKEVEDTIAKGGVYLGQEARAGKILGELKAAEGAAAQELKGHPELLHKEESLLHEAAARARDARKAFQSEARVEKKHAALLSEEHKVKASSGTDSSSHATAQTAQGALLGLASGLERVAHDDRDALAETDEVMRSAKKALGDSATSRRIQALMSRAKAYGRDVTSRDERAVQEARREAKHLRDVPEHTAAAVKFNKEQAAFTPEGFKVGSDEDIQNEVNKLMSEANAMQTRKKAFEAIHGPGTFKAPHAMAQSKHHGYRAQDSHKLSMSLAKKEAEANQLGSDADLHNEVAKLLHEAEADQYRVTLRDRAEASKSRAEQEQLGLQKRRGQKHRVSGGRGGHVGEQGGAKNYEELSVERRRQAKLSVEKAKQERAKKQKKLQTEASKEARDRHLLQELNTVRRDLVRSLQDGTEADDGAARTENSLIREAERVLQEAHAARKHEQPVALQQRGSSTARKSATSVAELAGRGAAMELRASKVAEKEARSEAKILHETKFAEAQVAKLLRGAQGARVVRKEVMRGLEKAQRAERRTIKAEAKEARRSRKAAWRMEQEARGLAKKA